jgi:hypothetical protein
MDKVHKHNLINAIYIFIPQCQRTGKDKVVVVVVVVVVVLN